jgi:hypothetical protein
MCPNDKDHMNSKDYYKTSDSAFAAFLMLHDYTLLDAVDDGEVGDRGFPRINLYLTHNDEVTRNNIHEEANKLRDEFQMRDKSFRQYFIHLQLVRKKLRTPIDSATGNRKAFEFKSAAEASS